MTCYGITSYGTVSYGTVSCGIWGNLLVPSPGHNSALAVALCAGKAVLKCATGDVPHSRGLSKWHPVCDAAKRFSNLGLGVSLCDDSIDMNTRFVVQKELRVPYQDVVEFI